MIKIIAAIAGFAVLSFASANAAVIFTVERISDSDANITVSGTLDTATDNFTLLGASATIGDTGLDPIGGDFVFDGRAVDFAFVRDGSTDFQIYNFITPDLAIGSTGVGVLSVMLDVETWAAIGTVGDVVDVTTGAFLGTYEIVGEIPLPAAAWLMIAGLAGLRAASKRKKTA